MLLGVVVLGAAAGVGGVSAMELRDCTVYCLAPKRRGPKHSELQSTHGVRLRCSALIGDPGFDQWFSRSWRPSNCDRGGGHRMGFTKRPEASPQFRILSGVILDQNGEIDGGSRPFCEARGWPFTDLCCPQHGGPFFRS